MLWRIVFLCNSITGVIWFWKLSIVVWWVSYSLLNILMQKQFYHLYANIVRNDQSINSNYLRFLWQRKVFRFIRSNVSQELSGLLLVLPSIFTGTIQVLCLCQGPLKGTRNWQSPIPTSLLSTTAPTTSTPENMVFRDFQSSAANDDP